MVLLLFVFVHLHTIAQIDDRAVQLYCLSLQEMIQKRNNKKNVNTYWIIIRKTTQNKQKTMTMKTQKVKEIKCGVFFLFVCLPVDETKDENLRNS